MGKVALNGRFMTMPVTGTQRYARESAVRLEPVLGQRLVTLAPSPRIRGLAGHLWEQFVLPRRSARVGAEVLLSLGNWGPLTVASQVIVVHDAAPFLHPEFYASGYAAWARVAWRALTRRARRLVTVSNRARADLAGALGVGEERFTVVPPGVGPPFVGATPGRETGEAGNYCVFVGAHDARKNLGFLLSFWPSMWGRHGIELHVVTRPTSRPHGRAALRRADGVSYHLHTSDEELATMYARARYLLWPSRYEGFGLPPLESMAAGTPFLSAGAGASPELADGGGRVLPLEPEAWVEAIRTEPSPEERQQARERASAYSWDRTALSLAEVLSGALP